MGGFRRGILAGTCLFSLLGYSAIHQTDEWTKESSPLFLTRLAANISPVGTFPGVVIAAPSKQNPNYFFHWVRDASLVMDVVVSLYLSETDAAKKNHYEKQLIDYIDFSRLNQTVATLSGGVGEPRYNVDGTANNDPWGRPQNDGPALRTIALARLAQRWLDEGKEALVRQKLYQAEMPANRVIKADLEFISHHWRDTCFDLWEEIRGSHFFTQIVQRRALIDGAALAQRLGDPKAADWYRQQAAQMESVIAWHWDASKGYIVSTLQRDGGIDYKSSNLDSSVVLGALYGQGDAFFKPSDDRVLATVLHLENAFNALYPINQKGLPATAIGRYPEDRYDGYSTGGQGNGWVLITAAFGDWYYTVAEEFRRAGNLQISEKNVAFFRNLGVLDTAQAPGQHFASNDPKFSTILSALRGKGDEYLNRVHIHAPDGHLSEQINRYTGFMQGAPDLTWSYAAILRAIHTRN